MRSGIIINGYYNHDGISYMEFSNEWTSEFTDQYQHVIFYIDVIEILFQIYWVKQNVKINFTFIFYFNVATRKFLITACEACIVFLLDITAVDLTISLWETQVKDAI